MTAAGQIASRPTAAPRRTAVPLRQAAPLPAVLRHYLRHYGSDSSDNSGAIHA